MGLHLIPRAAVFRVPQDADHLQQLENQPLVDKYIEMIDTIEQEITRLKATLTLAEAAEVDYEAPMEEAEEAAPEQPAQPARKTCPQCGAPVSDDALFCNKCGAQL